MSCRNSAPYVKQHSIWANHKSHMLLRSMTNIFAKVVSKPSSWKNSRTSEPLRNATFTTNNMSLLSTQKSTNKPSWNIKIPKNSKIWLNSKNSKNNHTIWTYCCSKPTSNAKVSSRKCFTLRPKKRSFGTVSIGSKRGH